jgi:hypothetical protein
MPAYNIEGLHGGTIPTREFKRVPFLLCIEKEKVLRDVFIPEVCRTCLTKLNTPTQLVSRCFFPINTHLHRKSRSDNHPLSLWLIVFNKNRYRYRCIRQCFAIFSMRSLLSLILFLLPIFSNAQFDENQRNVSLVCVRRSPDIRMRTLFSTCLMPRTEFTISSSLRLSSRD